MGALSYAARTRAPRCIFNILIRRSTSKGSQAVGGGHKLNLGLLGAFWAGAAVATGSIYKLQEWIRSDGRQVPNSSASLRSIIPVQKEARDFVVVVTDGDGNRQVVRLDAEELSAAAEAAAKALDGEVPALQARCRARVAAGVREAVFADDGARAAIAAFADWYYAYATAYELLRVAAGACLAGGTKGATERAVGRRILDQYEALVLRPDRTAPALRRALDAATAAARADFVATVARAHLAALPLLDAGTSHVAPGGGAGAGAGGSAEEDRGAAIEVDWASCARRAAGETARRVERSVSREEWRNCQYLRHTWRAG